jgi:hypothetical protein
MKDIDAYNKSLLLSICYVGASCIGLYSLFPNTLLHGDIALLIVFITLPVSFLSFGLMYTGGSIEHEKLIVFGIQVVMFLLTWYISYRMFKEKNPKIKLPPSST